MKSKNNNQKDKLKTPLKVFSDPARSRVLWHDTKVFASAANIYLDNMLSGVYGVLPGKVSDGLLNLRVAAIKQLITLELNSILNKLELNALKLNPKWQKIGPVLENAVHFLQPILDKALLKLKMKSNEKARLLLDERYSTTLLYSLIFMSIELLDEASQSIELTLEDKKIEIQFVTTLNSAELEECLSFEQIYNEKCVASGLTALSYLVILSLAERLSAELTITSKNKKIKLSYEHV